ncbi:unnamed protein product [Amaranthus hypochondriacus]
MKTEIEVHDEHYDDDDDDLGRRLENIGDGQIEVHDEHPIVNSSFCAPRVSKVATQHRCLQIATMKSRRIFRKVQKEARIEHFDLNKIKMVE